VGNLLSGVLVIIGRQPGVPDGSGRRRAEDEGTTRPVAAVKFAVVFAWR